ncbi:HlyD family type I secretion periplasmic adaptor subunit [Pseudomonadales bacterium]|jgi:membrane fusion protein, adhesin transport system|nr:HlyD family type I secretion periplasmic adaptor subunit [Pseudomonadales bacterium]
MTTRPIDHSARFSALTQTQPLSHLALWITAVFVLTAIIWANFAALEEITRADGRIIASSQTQVVQNLEGGILSAILVKEGDRVEKGQVLLQIDNTRFASSFNESQSAITTLRFKMLRLASEISGKPMQAPPNLTAAEQQSFNDEAQLLKSRQDELKSNLAILEQQRSQHKQAKEELQRELQKLAQGADYARQELAMTAPLVETGAVSQVELIRLKAAVNEAEGRLEGIRLKLPAQDSIVTEATQKIQERQQQYLAVAQEELTATRADLERLSYSKVALQDRVARTEVRSPANGIVNQILVTTERAVIQPGMDLLEIVPLDDTLLINAKVRPVDIAFIRPGQKATVKVTAYDFAIYGGLDATLEQISADTIVDETGEYFFQIRVRTAKNYLGQAENPLPIMPGMIATVDISTGEKTVMDYLLKPLKRATASALTER